MKLSDFQKQFMKSVMQTASEPELATQIVPKKNLSKDDQLEIYQDSIHGGFIKALEEVYPVVKRLVGEQYFTQLALCYIKQDQTKVQDLITFTQKFQDFLATFPPVAKDIPYLPDISQLEWAWYLAFIGEQEAPFDFEELNKVTAEKQNQLIFHLSKSASLVTSEFPIFTIWESNQEEGSNDIINLDIGGESVFVFRSDYDVKLVKLSEADQLLLNLFSQDLPFESICEKLNKLTPEIDISTLFPNYCLSGWITSFTLK